MLVIHVLVEPRASKHTDLKHLGCGAQRLKMVAHGHAKAKRLLVSFRFVGRLLYKWRFEPLAETIGILIFTSAV